MQIQKIANFGIVVIPDAWNLDPYLFIAMFAAVSVFLFYLIDRAGAQRRDRLIAQAAGSGQQATGE